MRRHKYPTLDEVASDAVCTCGDPFGEHRSTTARQCGLCPCGRFVLDRKAYATSRGWNVQEDK